MRLPVGRGGGGRRFAMGGSVSPPTKVLCYECFQKMITGWPTDLLCEAVENVENVMNYLQHIKMKRCHRGFLSLGLFSKPEELVTLDLHCWVEQLDGAE